MDKKASWLNHYVTLADLGDPSAQIAVAWEYVRGGYLPKDRIKAEQYFRSAECKLPEIARFHLGKAKLMWGESIRDELELDGQKGFGPAYYLIAIETQRKQGRHKALPFYKLAADLGHLVSGFMHWRLSFKLSKKSFLTIPQALRDLTRIMRIWFKNADDIRVIT